jgi:hypothetical protein
MANPQTRTGKPAWNYLARPCPAWRRAFARRRRTAGVGSGRNRIQRMERRGSRFSVDASTRADPSDSTASTSLRNETSATSSSHRQPCRNRGVVGGDDRYNMLKSDSVQEHRRSSSPPPLPTPLPHRHFGRKRMAQPTLRATCFIAPATRQPTGARLQLDALCWEYRPLTAKPSAGTPCHTVPDSPVENSGLRRVSPRRTGRRFHGGDVS